jgi:predicted hydrocarbon binding protein
MKPQIPIDVDAGTGVWSTDGLPMLYVPRHFFVNNHKAMEAALGRERYAALLYDAGYRSAWHWCDHESSSQGLTGIAVFEHYLNRLSQRGWGRFRFLRVDVDTRSADVQLDHSSFVLASPDDRGRVCYMFAGWFAGAMDWVLGDSAATTATLSEEIQCCAAGHAHCLFAVRARSNAPASDPLRA